MFDLPVESIGIKSTWRIDSNQFFPSYWMSANRLKLNTEKSELLWAGSRYALCSLTGCGPSLQLGVDTVTAQDDVRLLGVTISSDLSLQRRGLTCPQHHSIGCVSSDASSCIDFGMARLHGILLTVAHRSPMLSAGSDSGQLHSN